MPSGCAPAESGGDPSPQVAPEGPPRLALRWTIKLAGLLVLVYYALPPKVLGVPVYWAFPLAALLVVLIEVSRFLVGFSLPTLRDYERERVASYVYWAASLALLVAFFPEGLAVAALFAAALSDIAASGVRRAGGGRAASKLATWALYGAIAATVLLVLGAEPAAAAAVLAVAAGLVAALVEGIRWPGLDDDLLMPLVPALVVLGLSHVVPGSVPLTFHLPWLSRG